MTRRTRIVIAAVAATTVVLDLVVVLVRLRGDRTEPAAPTSTPTSPSGETTNLRVHFHRAG
ncbi:hypothetical protein [Lentzea aerocolonigenes]|uniref:hypothetical protein n=1 Tax=Lentzea aerocolonigenes TaxID=68170 RepID=UPI0004C40EFE|nr:hypothetical protein [Lentzea aerocolonigenes]MCP2250443.1 hypothetical protein [Lentzea aerocolonigenes]